MVSGPSVSSIVIRELYEPAEMKIGVELQKQIWNYSDLDAVPDQVFIVARESGGQVLAAFDGDTPVGFALAFAGAHGSKLHLHSHMVAVLPVYQGRKIGKKLKLAQRDAALARGIDLIEWTFDPLQLKNAHFNIARLGAIVRRYKTNFYGRTSSPLHAGLPTDRLVAEWWLVSDRVLKALENEPIVTRKSQERITVPANIREICIRTPQEAEKIQARIREEFARLTNMGWAAVGFEICGEQGSYILESYED
jgi:predicted GNAT superfamily acetyltransferase